jgi:hypothetical protein
MPEIHISVGKFNRRSGAGEKLSLRSPRELQHFRFFSHGLAATRQSDFIQRIVICRMSTMRELQSRIHQSSQPRSLAANTNSRLHVFAAYGAFLMIAGIVFGTLPFRAF